MEHIVSQYLGLLKISISKQYCEKHIASHPDYPSLLSIVDTLERLGITYHAARVKKHDLKQLPFPYLVQSEENGALNIIKKEGDLEQLVSNGKETFSPFVNVKQNEEQTEHNTLDNHPKTEAEKELVVLQAEWSDTLRDKENEKQLAVENFIRGIKILFLSALTILFLYPVTMLFSLFQWMLFLTAGAGVAVSYLLLAKDVGIAYSPVENFCRSGAKTNCDAVLNSDAAKFRLFGGTITLSELATSYFLYQLLVLVCLVPFVESASFYLLTLALLSGLTIPVMGYTLYYQYARTKMWCRLCLLIDAILCTQVILFGYMLFTDIIPVVSIMQIFAEVGLWPPAVALFLFAGIFAAVVLIKNTIQKANEAEQAEITANRVKNNPEVFLHLLRKQKQVDTTPLEHELRIGNPNAPLTVTMAASLGCSPCKTGFEKATELVETYPDKINVTIRFRFLRLGEEDPRPPSEDMYLLSYWRHHIVGKSDEQVLTGKLLRDWYTLRNVREFKRYYPYESDGYDQKTGNLAAQHNLWMEREELAATPTFFINRYQLPGHYRIEDLKAIMPGLPDHFAQDYEQEKKWASSDAKEGF